MAETTVGSISRALDLLEALSADAELGLSEVARRTGLRPSTAHRQLATLTSRGYVQRNEETGCYMLGYGVLQLARRVEQRDSHLRVRVNPYLVRVRKVCRETTNLVVIDGPEIVYIRQLPGLGAMRMFAEPGRRVPAHATAAGKAMMSFMSAEAVRDCLAGVRLRRFTENTIVSRPDLSKELDTVRQRGFAFDIEEYEAAVSCVAAPIFDAHSAVIAALSVSGPTARLGGPRDRDELGELVLAAALDASREFGYERRIPPGPDG